MFCTAEPKCGEMFSVNYHIISHYGVECVEYTVYRIFCIYFLSRNKCMVMGQIFYICFYVEALRRVFWTLVCSLVDYLDILAELFDFVISFRIRSDDVNDWEWTLIALIVIFLQTPWKVNISVTVLGIVLIILACHSVIWTLQCKSYSSGSRGDPVKTSQKIDGCHTGPQVSGVIRPPFGQISGSTTELYIKGRT